MFEKKIISDITWDVIHPNEHVLIEHQFWYWSEFDTWRLRIDSTLNELEILFDKKIDLKKINSRKCFVSGEDLTDALLSEKSFEPNGFLPEVVYIRFSDLNWYHSIPLSEKVIKRFFEKNIYFEEDNQGFNPEYYVDEDWNVIS